MAVASLAVGVSSAARPGGAAAPGTGQLASPLRGSPEVVTPFDPPPQRWLAGHRGVDLASDPLAPVFAPGEATVHFAGRVGGKPVVSLDHGGGLRTTYEPVTATVRAGQIVAGGDRIGTLVGGHPGCPVTACLHWGARVDTAAGGRSEDDGDGGDGDYIDPLSLLHTDTRPIVLKPTRPGDGQG